MMLYTCNKFHETILGGMKVKELTRFSLEKISKGRNSTNIAGGVTILILCTSSDNNGLYLYLVS